MSLHACLRLLPLSLLVVGGANLVLACNGDDAEPVSADDQALGAACRTRDHCDFLQRFGPDACNAAPECKEVEIGAGCHGSAVASASQARFCESAMSQVNPHQACQIWGSTFNCLWTPGLAECVARQDGTHGSADACSVADHCRFFGERGRCDSVRACRENEANACVPAQSSDRPSSCAIGDHCAFFGELGQCEGISACKPIVNGAGCHGSAVASASQARFCEGAMSQINPAQACAIWGPTFNCVWTEGASSCVAQSGAGGDSSACSVADHCSFLGSLGQCESVSACRQAGSDCIPR